MTEEVQQALAQDVPDLPVTDATAETPEVAEQEKPADETVEQRLERLEKEAYAKQRRIDRLIADKSRTQGENRELRARQEQFEAMLRAQQSPEEQQQDTPQALEQRARQLAQQQIAQERFDAACNEFVAKGSKLVKGFDKVVATVAAEVPLFDHRNAPTPFLGQLLQCDAPHKVLAHLAENPEVAADLADLPPIRIARRLAKIETELAQPKTTSASSAPKPIAPVRSAATAGAPPETDRAGWIAWRNAQMLKR